MILKMGQFSLYSGRCRDGETGTKEEPQHYSEPGQWKHPDFLPSPTSGEAKGYEKGKASDFSPLNLMKDL